MPDFKRLLCPPDTSFFLFGPRSVGKSTWIDVHFKNRKVIDLLDQSQYLELARAPNLLEAKLSNTPDHEWICIDEIQKVPALLDEVHRLMTRRKWKFALTGSSARKLKRGGANLLAGRAITRTMEGLSLKELDGALTVDAAIELGTLPLVVNQQNIARDILSAYVATYIKEEIREEGVVRKIDPFLRFLEVAGLCNGQKIVLQNIARDAKVPASNLANYFSILTDTLIGHWLRPYQPGAKVREVSHSKFYWFDSGVARAAAGLLYEPLDSLWSGFALETLIFHELRTYNEIAERHREIFYYETGAGSEIDFIIELSKKRGGQKASVVTLEVKNSRTWKREWEKASRNLAESAAVNVAAMYGVYRGREVLVFDDFKVYPVEIFVEQLFGSSVF